jgi:HPt (histidine-containing phosphotransfer) domain-containing protein
VTPLEQRIAELSARFSAQAGHERDALLAALAAGDRETLQSRAHKLAGTAGMFGHDDIGEAAFALETAAELGTDCTGPARRLAGMLGELAP